MGSAHLAEHLPDLESQLGGPGARPLPRRSLASLGRLEGAHSVLQLAVPRSELRTVSQMSQHAGGAAPQRSIVDGHMSSSWGEAGGKGGGSVQCIAGEWGAAIGTSAHAAAHRARTCEGGKLRSREESATRTWAMVPPRSFSSAFCMFSWWRDPGDVSTD